MRKHLAWYSRGVPGAARFRTAVNRFETVDETVAALTEFFAQEIP